MNKTPSPMSRQRFVLISILFFHSVNTYMDRACISNAAEPMQEALKIGPTMWGWILGIFGFGYALFQIPSGWIADRFGPRKALGLVVAFWSTFTMLTGVAWGAVSLLVMRFMFGMGEAGAFPGATRAFFSWLPAKERGLAQGINFSGSRIGAAVSFLIMPYLINELIGWRWTFFANGIVGIIWAAVWLYWFRDDPKDNKKITQAELDYIQKVDAQDEAVTQKSVSFMEVFSSKNVILAMIQYFSQNVTFFTSITWIPLYLKQNWGGNAELLAAIPMFFAAFSNWTAGGMVTILYKLGFPVGSRRITAMTGYALGAFGMFAATQTDNAVTFIAFYSVAIFGVDMVLSPSWAFCMDIGGDKSGAVSGAMNMVGNIGAALSAIAFPIFQESVTIPVIAPEAGTVNSYFFMAGVLNIVSVVCWMFMDPRKPIPKRSPKAIKTRFTITLIVLVGLTLASVLCSMLYKIYWK